jgi:hypothetical protein
VDIVLCTCDQWPDPHHHALATVYEPIPGSCRVGAATATHHTYPNGQRAEVGDVVVYVDWRVEALRLAEVAAGIYPCRRHLRGKPCREQAKPLDPCPNCLLQDALARFREAEAQDGRAVRGPDAD